MNASYIRCVSNTVKKVTQLPRLINIIFKKSKDENILNNENIVIDKELIDKSLKENPDDMTKETNILYDEEVQNTTTKIMQEKNIMDLKNIIKLRKECEAQIRRETLALKNGTYVEEEHYTIDTNKIILECYQQFYMSKQNQLLAHFLDLLQIVEKDDIMNNHSKEFLLKKYCDESGYRENLATGKGWLKTHKPQYALLIDKSKNVIRREFQSQSI